MPNIPTTYTDLPGYVAGQYDIQMVRLALAIADVLTAYGFSSGGGGGGGGDASAANQTTEIARLEAIRDRLPAALVSDRLKVDGSGVTQPVSASSLPLPTNAASQSDVQSVRNRLMPDGTQTVYMGTSAGANLKTSAGNVYSFSCTNLNASSTRYFQLFDTSGVPGGTPIASFPVYPNAGFLSIGQDLIGGNGIPFTTGIAWGFSSTSLTYTAATATDCIARVRWT